MGWIPLGSNTQLQFEIPTKRTEGWADELRSKFFDKLVIHDHSGINGMGTPINGAGIAPDSIKSTNILLDNNTFLRSWNSTNSSVLNLLKAGTSGAATLGRDTLVFESNGSRLSALTPGNELQLDNTLGTASLRVLGDITADNGLIQAQAVVAPLVEGDNLVTVPRLDPVAAFEGQLMVSNGVDRAKGLWVRQDGAWTSPAVADGSITTNKLATDAVTNDKLADMAANTVKANATASSTDPSDITIPTNTVLGRKSGNIVAQQLIGDQITNGTITKEKLDTTIYALNTTTTPQVNDSLTRLINSVSLSITTLRPILVTISGHQIQGTPTTDIRSTVSINMNLGSSTGSIEVFSMIMGGVSAIGSTVTSPVSGQIILVPASTGIVNLAAWGGSTGTRDSQYTTTMTATQL